MLSSWISYFLSPPTSPTSHGSNFLHCFKLSIILMYDITSLLVKIWCLFQWYWWRYDSFSGLNPSFAPFLTKCSISPQILLTIRKNQKGDIDIYHIYVVSFIFPYCLWSISSLWGGRGWKNSFQVTKSNFIIYISLQTSLMWLNMIDMINNEYWCVLEKDWSDIYEVMMCLVIFEGDEGVFI